MLEGVAFYANSEAYYSTCMSVEDYFRSSAWDYPRADYFCNSTFELNA
jgi:hypothetical protein